MKGDSKKPLPKFGHPSRELREAVRIIHDARFANAMAVRTGKWKLTQPLSPPSPQFEAAMRLVAETGNKRFAALYEHFLLRADLPGAGAVLAYRLACELIPGFDPYYIPARGRPESVRNDYAAFVEAVRDARKQNSKLSIVQACAKVAKADTRFRGKTSAGLAAAYHRFVKQDAKIIELIEDYRHSEK